MSNVVKHTFASTISDKAGTHVKPSHWNAEHTIGGGVTGAFLIRDTAASDGANWSTAYNNPMRMGGGGTSAALQLDPNGAAAGNTFEVRCLELAANGTRYVGFKAPDSIEANNIWVLPNADGSAGQVLKTDGNLNLSWVTGGGVAVGDSPTWTGNHTWSTAAATWKCNALNMALGRSGVISTSAYLRIGDATGSNYDLSIAGGEGYIVSFVATIRNTVNADWNIGWRAFLGAWDDGSARTVTNLASFYYANDAKGPNTTVTNHYGFWLQNPTLGGTLNRVIDSQSLAYLTTAGIWTDNSSRESKQILARLDTPASFAARLTELQALRPVLFRFQADHVIRPKRRYEDLSPDERERFPTFADAMAGGVTSDARWNPQTQQYEAFRRGRWDVVGVDAKAEELGVIAEELPPIMQTKDGKGFSGPAGFAWLVEVCKAQQIMIDDLTRRVTPPGPPI